MKRTYFLTALLSVALLCLAGCNKINGNSNNDSADNAETPSNAPMVKVETSAGDFIITLQPDKAPKTVARFLENVNNKVYDNTIIHNVIYNHEILIAGIQTTQESAENPNETALENPGEPSNEAAAEKNNEIPNEATSDNPNKKWTVAMNREAKKTTSDPIQFFINMKDNFELDVQPGGESSPDSCGYCVFGIVTDGFDALEAINKTTVTIKGEFEYAPEPDIVITKISVLENQ